MRRVILNVVSTALFTSCAMAPPGLVRLAEEAAGANCSLGGVAVESGVDADLDGQLSDDEVDSIAYVCNGDDGTDGGSGPAGSGADGEDGATGASGSDGSSTLIDLTDEPAGDNCPFGGVRVDAGVDDNGDGLLDVEEIDDTAYVCDGASITGVLEGHYTIRNTADWALITGVTEITGDLVINSSALTTVSLPQLTDIGGSLQIIDTALVDLDGLPALNAVQGTVTLQFNPLLTDVGGTTLGFVGGDLNVLCNDTLDDAHATSTLGAASVSGTVTIGSTSGC